MANKDKLKEMLNKRNPLLETKREAVTPVDFYKPEVNELKDNSLYFKPNPNIVDKTTSTQVDKTTSIQTGKDTKPQTVKPISPQVVKYTTHLQPSTIKAIKRLAVETDRRDYEIVEEALGEYLKKGTPHK